MLNPSDKKIKREKDIALFAEYHAKYPSHGYRWLRAKIELDTGTVYSDNYAQRVCSYAGIRSVSKHIRRYKGTNRVKIYPNMLMADMAINDPMQVVVSDMTAFWANGRYWELTLYMDLYNNSIISYSMSPVKGDPKTYMEGLKKLLEKKKEYAGLSMILHSDQGAVCSSKSFNELLPACDITRSAPRAGTPTDNGAMEAINGWMKDQLFSDFSIRECEDVEGCVKAYIEYFNERRPAFALGYPTSKQFTENFYGSWNGTKSEQPSSSNVETESKQKQTKRLKKGQQTVHFLLTSANTMVFAVPFRIRQTRHFVVLKWHNLKVLLGPRATEQCNCTPSEDFYFIIATAYSSLARIAGGFRLSLRST